MKLARAAFAGVSCAALFLFGCSSGSRQGTQQTSATPPTSPATAPQSLAAQPSVVDSYPRPAQDVSMYDPEIEAAKIGFKLYPGARMLSMPYQIRRGNYYQQREFFTTSDSHVDVLKFYNEAYGQGTFQDTASGVASGSIVQIGSRDSYIVYLRRAADGETHIEVTAIRTCEGMYPAPCDGTPKQAESDPH